MASSTLNRWLRPEVYPLFAAVGVAVGICGMQLIRNISTNPEVRPLTGRDSRSAPLSVLRRVPKEIKRKGICLARVTKQNRAAGVLDNFDEGERYAEHGVRKFVRNKTPQIMPSINKFFSDPN